MSRNENQPKIQILNENSSSMPLIRDRIVAIVSVSKQPMDLYIYAERAYGLTIFTSPRAHPLPERLRYF